MRWLTIRYPDEAALRARYLEEKVDELIEVAQSSDDPLALAFGDVLDDLRDQADVHLILEWMVARAEVRSAEIEKYAAHERERVDAALRREEQALQVECPFCGAAPGVSCRTVSVAATVRDHHRDRFRAATGLLSPQDPGAASAAPANKKEGS